MAHKTLVNGTAYDVKSGKVLVGGTGYDVKNGKTLVNGTGYTIKFGTPIGELAVGSTVYMNVNGNRVPFTIVHKGNPNTSLYDSSCDGIWVWGNHPNSESYVDNFTSIGGPRPGTSTFAWNAAKTSGHGSCNKYNYSTINFWLNNDFLWSLDSGIRSLIKTVKIPYFDKDSSSVASGSNGLSTKAFLISYLETGLSVGNAPIVGSKLDYFLSGTDTEAAERRKLVFYRSNGNMVAGYWVREVPLKSDNQNSYCFQVGNNSTLASRSMFVGSGSLITPTMIFSYEATVDDNFNIIPSGSAPIVFNKETWVINESPTNYYNFSGNEVIPVGFECAGYRCNGIYKYYFDDTLYGFNYVWNNNVSYVYNTNTGSISQRWSNQSYRTIILDYPATGNMLTWLSANATKQ